MNAGISIGFHASIASLIKKTQGDFNRISEFILIRKCSNKFSNVYIFTSDYKNYQHYMPKNCTHIPLGGRLKYIFFGWLVILTYIKKREIKILFIEGCTALFSTFLLNKITKVKTFLIYNYSWYITYATDIRKKSIIIKIRKSLFFPFIVKIVEKILIQFIDYFLVAAPDIKKFIHNNKKIVNLNIGIVLQEFDSDRIEPDPIYNRIRGPAIVYTSRLVPLKNPLALIKAYFIAKQHIPRLNLIICGDGELMKDCKKMADNDNNVHILGFVKNVPQLLKGASVFVLTPSYDASPRSLIEAMAMGVPCITSRVGGIPEYIDESCGIFVEPGNENQLAEKIIFLFNNKTIANNLGKHAKKRVLLRYDLDKNYDEMLKFMINKCKIE